jgi:ABC-2 type transport system permease protein
MSAQAYRPVSLRWLMAHELRLFWRRGKMRPKNGLILAGFLLSIWALVSFFIFMRVAQDLPEPPFTQGPGAGVALTAIGIIIAFIASVMTSGAILAAVDAIYTRNDLDLLLSSPVSPWRVLTVRSAAIAVSALPLYAGLLAPPLLWLAIFSSPLWLTSIAFLLSLAFAATGVALLIVTALFRLIGPRNTRVLAQIISAVAGAAVFLVFQWYNINARDEPMNNQEMASLLMTLDIDPQVWWLLPSRAFTGDIPSILLWLVLVAGLFPLGVFVFSHRFVADAAAASAMGKKKQVRDGRVAAVRGGLMRSVIRKEMRLLTRDPLLLSQIGMQIVYLIPLGFILLRPDRGFDMTAAAFVPALALLASTLSGSLIWITVSAEDAPDLIASAPVAPSVVDRAKLFAAIAPVWALMVIPVGALFARDVTAGLWGLAGVIAASVFSALIGLWRRNPGSRKEFVRRRAKGSVLVGLGQALVAFGVSATVGLGAFNLPWLALIPAIITAAVMGALYKPTPKFPEPA